MKENEKLPFEDRYTYAYAKKYYYRHKTGLLKQWSNSLEQRMARRALRMAGLPAVVLDLPCGAGRFLHTLLKYSNSEKIIAADQSEGMLNVIEENFPAEVLDKVNLLQTSAFHIDLDDKSVDSILCMRLLHHIHDPDYRNKIYAEFRRVSRWTVCISYWVDGNYKSYCEYRRSKKDNDEYRCLNRIFLESELINAGFTIIGHVDMLKGLLYWRTYVLGT